MKDFSLSGMEKLTGEVLQVLENKKFLIEWKFFGIFQSEAQQTFPINFLIMRAKVGTYHKG